MTESHEIRPAWTEQMIQYWSVDFYNRACDLYQVAIAERKVDLAKDILRIAEEVMRWQGFMEEKNGSK